MTLNEFRIRTQQLVDEASAFGWNITVSQKPLLPLAMGHHETVVEVWTARHPAPTKVSPSDEEDDASSMTLADIRAAQHAPRVQSEQGQGAALEFIAAFGHEAQFSRFTDSRPAPPSDAAKAGITCMRAWPRTQQVQTAAFPRLTPGIFNGELTMFEQADGKYVRLADVLATLPAPKLSDEPNLNAQHSMTAQETAEAFTARMRDDHKALKARATLLELWATHVDASMRAKLMQVLVDYLEAVNALVPAVASGWRFVPEGSTEEMIAAGAKAAREYMDRAGGNSPQAIFSAMLAASPSRPCEHNLDQATPDKPEGS